ncbi:4'-phosphopantetheinyl transferase family protein [Bacillus mycoides]|uniref:4'-phosphopantetheinyl transferase family protein n=1 Tax=Bacillus mycoides TaxID=1405 RepID=UPI000A27B4E9|nr:4'-phosphopantetheinyl transferase superfamily protein [Bacillus mycoides]OSX93232.1 hypothetical protein BTJ44_01047 [Bacillus mycoides]
MLELYLANITDFSDEQYQTFYKTADSAKTQEINAFRKNEDKQRSLLSNHLLIKLLNVYTQKKIKISKNEYGKKYLTNNEVFFNISHSGNWVLLGISDHEIGVDIEKIEPLDYIGLSTFFSEPEQDYLKSLHIEYLKNEFYRIWTANESYVKFLGKGLSIQLNSFIVPLTKNNNRVLNLSRGSHKKPQIQSFFLEDYSISICNHKFDDLSFNYYNATDELVMLNNKKDALFPEIKLWE